MEFYFFNHSSFGIFKDGAAFVVDPWFEGGAFKNYWLLQCDETSNEKFFQTLKVKRIHTLHIWISHEHSDHFSVPFMMALKKVNCLEKVCIHMFDYKDGRVGNFIKKQGFEFFAHKTGVDCTIDDNFIIRGGIINRDSFIHIICDNFTILNINDCPAHSLEDLEKIKSFLNTSKRIDILASQFGYASWLGNLNDTERRIKESRHYLNSVKDQIRYFKANYYLPFASFSYFATEENFYLNQEQNYIGSASWNTILEPFEDVIMYLRPFESINLKKKIQPQIATKSEVNKKFWYKIFNDLKPQTKLEPKEFDKAEILQAGSDYIKKINQKFLFAPVIVSRLQSYEELIFLINDLDIKVSLDYKNGCRETDTKHIDIAINADDFCFMLEREYGFDTIFIGGALQIFGSMHKINAFFNFQVYEREGLGKNNIIYTIFYFIKRKLF